MGVIRHLDHNLPYPAINKPAAQQQPAPSNLFGGLQITDTPLQTFLADIIVPPSTNQIIDVNALTQGRCVGFCLLLQSSYSCQVSINGGGMRTVNAAMIVDGALINTLQIATGLGGVIVQLNGV